MGKYFCKKTGWAARLAVQDTNIFNIVQQFQLHTNLMRFKASSIKLLYTTFWAISVCRITLSCFVNE